MATRTLLQLRTEARQRADMENDDSFITDTEATRFINQSIKRLYDLLLTNQGGDYYVASNTFSTVGGTDTYALPAGFYRLLGIDVNFGGPRPVPLKPFMFHERNDYRYNTGWNYYEAVRYRILGSNIQFIPIPGGVFSVTLWYIPTFTDLVADGDLFDGFNGWEEWVVVDSAIKMQEKEENVQPELVARLAGLTAQIEALAEGRDHGFPQRVIDTSDRYWWW